MQTVVCLSGSGDIGSCAQWIAGSLCNHSQH